MDFAHMITVRWGVFSKEDFSACLCLRINSIFIISSDSVTSRVHFEFKEIVLYVCQEFLFLRINTVMKYLDTVLFIFYFLDKVFLNNRLTKSFI